MPINSPSREQLELSGDDVCLPYYFIFDIVAFVFDVVVSVAYFFYSHHRRNNVLRLYNYYIAVVLNFIYIFYIIIYFVEAFA